MNPAVTRRLVIGVMGAGEGALPAHLALAEQLGEAIAGRGWVLLTGGRPVGVMDAASRGAKRVADSLVIGVLPDAAGPVSPHVDVAIYTDMGQARNVVNVLSSDVIVAIGVTGAGTASEVALAIKADKPVILLAPLAEAAAFFDTLGGQVMVAATVDEVITHLQRLLSR